MEVAQEMACSGAKGSTAILGLVVALALVISACGGAQDGEAVEPDSVVDTSNGDQPEGSPEGNQPALPVVAVGDVSIDDVPEIAYGCAVARALFYVSIDLDVDDDLASFDPNGLVEAFEPILSDELLAQAAFSLGMELSNLLAMRDAALAEIENLGTFDALQQMAEVLTRDC